MLVRSFDVDDLNLVAIEVDAVFRQQPPESQFDQRQESIAQPYSPCTLRLSFGACARSFMP